MRITKLEIRGFKSFPDRTAIEFPEGLSAVVGPNGCGKSNIVDAIRWVMGEQNARQLRGRSMEDVIFGGSIGHKPLGMAEVSLYLSNDNDDAPAVVSPFSEVMITRRLYRSGESEYLINRAPCRLKDVSNLFYDSGLGNKNYTIIEQGKINVVVDMKSDERRMLIEEAAGISKYKGRKKESLRKLEQSEQNLQRVKDIIGEVERQLKSLKRQAAKARQYQKLKKDLRDLELSKSFSRFRALSQERQSAAEKLQRTEREAEDLRVRRDTVKAGLEAIQMSCQEQEDRIRERYTALYGLKDAINKKERETERIASRLEELKRQEDTCVEELTRTKVVLLNLERDLNGQETARETAERSFLEQKELLEEAEAELESRSSASRQLTAELEKRKKELVGFLTKETELKNGLLNLERFEQDLERRRKSLEREREEIGQSLEEAEYGLQQNQRSLEEHEELELQLSGETAEAEAELRRLKELMGQGEARKRKKESELHSLEGRLSSMMELWDRRQWLGNGVRAVMEAGGTKNSSVTGIKGLVADVVRTPREYETALEAALGHMLEGVLMQDRECTTDAVKFLHHKGSGRCTFIPLSHTNGSNGNGSCNGAPLLCHKVSSAPPHEGLGEFLLKDFLVAADIDEAWKLWEQYHAPIATMNGEIINACGVVTGGRENQQTSRILSKKREIEELEAVIAANQEEIAAMDRELDGFRSDMDGVRENLEVLKERKAEMEEGLSEIRQELFRCEERLRTLTRRNELIGAEIDHLDRDSEDMKEKREKTERDAAEVSGKKKESEREIESLDLRCREAGEALEKERELLYARKLEVHTLQEQLSHLKKELERLSQTFEDGRSRRQRLEKQLDELRTERDTLFDKETDSRDELTSLAGQLEAAKQELKGLEEQRDQALEEVARLSAEAKERETALSAVRESLAAVQLTFKQVELTLSHLVDESRTRHGVDISRPDPSLAVEETDESEVDSHIDHIRETIEKLGEVNPMAIQEYEALNERFEFLQKQHDDLTASIEDIHQAIRKINRTCKEKFLETLQLVNENLRKVFPILFNGGKAELLMAEPDKPLDSGIEIVIHPPGKKLTTMGLLSGGEKALTALALLFSMYLIKPSPFCLLDEIDAPLDEANIDRFNDLLTRMAKDSQVILITHNRRTMEIVDRLYGVTMERPGVSKLISLNLEEATAA